MVSVFNHLLLALCLSDLVFLLSNLAMSPMVLHFHSYPADLYHTSECVCHMALATSIFLTSMLSMERHHAVFDPHHYQYRLARRGHKMIITYYVLPTLVMAFILNIPK